MLVKIVLSGTVNLKMLFAGLHGLADMTQQYIFCGKLSFYIKTKSPLSFLSGLLIT